MSDPNASEPTVTQPTITQGMVVSIDYVLTNPGGEELDRSAEDEPMIYLHGAKNIVPGLEAALEGKRAGDSLRVEVPPEKGYGPRQKVKPTRVLRSKFPDEVTLEKGARFVMQGPEGRPVPIWVSKVQGREVQVTTQHPLAGVTLCFDVTVRDVREATEEEKAHGHAHGPGGHQHDDDAEGAGSDEASGEEVGE